MVLVALLLGMAGSAFLFGELLANFNEIRLIQIIQGVAVTQTHGQRPGLDICV